MDFARGSTRVDGGGGSPVLDTANCANLAGSKIAAAAAIAGVPYAHIRDSQNRTGSIARGGVGGADDMM
jgi:hypothetical protein